LLDTNPDTNQGDTRRYSTDQCYASVRRKWLTLADSTDTMIRGGKQATELKIMVSPVRIRVPPLKKVLQMQENARSTRRT
jgi:hypothetical protein